MRVFVSYGLKRTVETFWKNSLTELAFDSVFLFISNSSKLCLLFPSINLKKRLVSISVINSAIPICEKKKHNLITYLGKSYARTKQK